MNYEIIKIDKTNYPIFFGFNGLRKYCKKTGTSLNKLMTLGQNMTLEEALQLMLVGIEEGCRKANQPFDLTIDDLGDLLDTDTTALTKAMEIFGEQMAHNVEVPKDGKKKTKEKVKFKKLNQ